jgi:hypothetical protein
MIAIGIPVADWIGVLLPVAFGVASYLLFRKRTKPAVQTNVVAEQNLALYLNTLKTKQQC